jgi:hypothetical protein
MRLEADPAGLMSLEDELGSGSVRFFQQADWPPEVIRTLRRGAQPDRTQDLIVNLHAEGYSLRVHRPVVVAAAAGHSGPLLAYVVIGRGTA